MRITIRKKIIGGFSVILLLMIILGGFSLLTVIKTQRIDKATRDILKLDMFLDETMGEHLVWMNDLADQFLLGKPFIGEINPHQCDFGRWYNSFKSDNPEIMKIHAALDEPHKRLHNAGKKIKAIYAAADLEADYDKNFEAREIYVKEAQTAGKEVREKVRQMQVILMNEVERLAEKGCLYAQKAVWGMTLMVNFAVFIGFIIAVLVSRGILRPIVKLRNAAVEIGKGNMDIKVEIQSKDEMGELEVTFNQMAQGLKKSKEEIEDYSKNLKQKVEERTEELKAANKELESSNEEIKQANEELELTIEELRAAHEETQKLKEAAEKKAAEFERFNKVAVDREIKMRELKARIAELEGKLENRES